MYRPEPKSTRRPKAILGTHRSIVTDIFYDPDFADKDAIRIKYRITTDDGKEFDYSELFYNNEHNERTQALFDYLDSNGIDINNVEKFKGCHERITIKKRVDAYNVARPSIVDREFVAYPEEVQS